MRFIGFLLCAATGLAQSVVLYPGTSGVIVPRTIVSIFDASSTSEPASILIRPHGTTTNLIAVEPPSSPQVVGIISPLLTFIVPANLPVGSADVLWRRGTQPYRWINVKVVANNFLPAPGGIDGIGLSTPARHGQLIGLRGAGLGIAPVVTATIGGVSAPVAFAGPVGPPGADEIKIQIPPSAPVGCYVPLEIVIGEARHRFPISVTADGSPCIHPAGLTTADLQHLDRGGYIAHAEVRFDSALSVAMADAAARRDSAYMQVVPADRTGIAGLFPPPAAAGCAAEAPVTVTRVGILPTIPENPDLGGSLILIGPDSQFQLKGSRGYYAPEGIVPQPERTVSYPPFSFFTPGPWTVSFPDSKDLALSTLTFNVPTTARLASSIPIPIDRDRDFTLGWQDNGTLSALSILSSSASTCSDTHTVPANRLSGFTRDTLGKVTLSLRTATQFRLLRLRNGQPLLVSFIFDSSDSRPADIR